MPEYKGKNERSSVKLWLAFWPYGIFVTWKKKFLERKGSKMPVIEPLRPHGRTRRCRRHRHGPGPSLGGRPPRFTGVRLSTANPPQIHVFSNGVRGFIGGFLVETPRKTETGWLGTGEKQLQHILGWAYGFLPRIWCREFISRGSKDATGSSDFLEAREAGIAGRDGPGPLRGLRPQQLPGSRPWRNREDKSAIERLGFPGFSFWWLVF